MRKLSAWGRAHKRAARIIIILSFIVLNITGLLTGSLLSGSGVHFPAWLQTLPVILFLLAVAAYPFRHLKNRLVSARKYYTWQKSCDFVLALSAFGLMLGLGNSPDTQVRWLNKSFAARPAISYRDSLHPYQSLKVFNASMRDANGNLLKWKERKKMLKTQVKAIKKADELSEGAKITLIILSVLVALGLLLLVASLACELSCNGSDGAAILVGLGGAGLVVLLFLVALRAIEGRKRKKKQADPET